MADKSGWSSGAQAVAALTTALLAVGAFFGLQRESGRDASAPSPSASVAPSPSPSATSAPAQQIETEAVRASLTLGEESSDKSRQAVNAVVTLRIANRGQVPVMVAWLDARNGAALDLDDGTRIAANRDSSFSGFPDCDHDRADECGTGNTTTLVPGESQIATVTLKGEIAATDKPRLAGARSGEFTARLSVRPGREADAYARSVSLEKMPLVNAVR